VLTTEWDLLSAAGHPFDEWTAALTSRDDSTWQDLDAACRYECCHDDRASCDADPGCMSVLGRDVLSQPELFAGCAPKGTCRDEGICAASEKTGECFQFSSSCVPEGWIPISCNRQTPTRVGDVDVSCEPRP
jgi:hypothetical protein